MKLVLYRQYKDHILPWRPKRVETKLMGVRHTRGSRLTTFDARYRHGGFEINVFEANAQGFEAALALLPKREVHQAHIVRLDADLTDPGEIELWMFNQLKLNATKRLK